MVMCSSASREALARACASESDGADPQMLADMVRTVSHQLRAAAGDSPRAHAIKMVALAHQTRRAAAVPDVHPPPARPRGLRGPVQLYLFGLL
jgi:hypothetical protein